MAASNFEEAGIKFEVIGEADYERALDFLYTHFFPDEPLSRSLGFTSSWLVSYIITDIMKKGESIMAKNPAGEIVGVRIAEVVHRSSWGDWLADKMIKKVMPFVLWLIPDFLLPKSLQKIHILSKLMDRVEYKLWKIFSLVDRKVMLNSLCLCASRTSGLRGLGTELLKRSEQLGKDKGCDYAASIVTGIYSQACFNRLEYSQLNKIVYADFKDDNGELYLKDTREHISCVLFTKDLK